MRALRSIHTLIAAVLAPLDCSPADAVAPGPDTIRLTMVPTDHDPDAYEGIVGRMHRPISTGTTITLDSLFAPGTHTVQLEGAGYVGYPEMWGQRLTRGRHSNPAWRP